MRAQNTCGAPPLTTKQSIWKTLMHKHYYANIESTWHNIFTVMTSENASHTISQILFDIFSDYWFPCFFFFLALASTPSVLRIIVLWFEHLHLVKMVCRRDRIKIVEIDLEVKRVRTQANHIDGIYYTSTMTWQRIKNSRNSCFGHFVSK